MKPGERVLPRRLFRVPSASLAAWRRDQFARFQSNDGSASAARLICDGLGEAQAVSSRALFDGGAAADRALPARRRPSATLARARATRAPRWVGPVPRRRLADLTVGGEPPRAREGGVNEDAFMWGRPRRRRRARHVQRSPPGRLRGCAAPAFGASPPARIGASLLCSARRAARRFRRGGTRRSSRRGRGARRRPVGGAARATQIRRFAKYRRRQRITRVDRWARRASVLARCRRGRRLGRGPPRVRLGGVLRGQARGVRVSEASRRVSLAPRRPARGPRTPRRTRPRRPRPPSRARGGLPDRVGARGNARRTLNDPTLFCEEKWTLFFSTLVTTDRAFRHGVGPREAAARRRCAGKRRDVRARQETERVCEHGRLHCKECPGKGRHAASTGGGKMRLQGVRGLELLRSQWECGGSICEHGRQRSQQGVRGLTSASIEKYARSAGASANTGSQCKECGGSSICEHGRQRYNCKECGGASFWHLRARDTARSAGEKGSASTGGIEASARSAGAGASASTGGSDTTARSARERHARSQCRPRGSRALPPVRPGPRSWSSAMT